MSLLLIIGVAAYGFAQRRYLYNFFAGPFEVDGNSLKSIQYPDDQFRYFIKVRGEDSTDTGLQEVEQETESGSVRRETVKANYSLMFVGKRVLVVKSTPNEKGPVFQGALCELPTDLRNQIVRPLLKKYPNAIEAFLALMLDATGFRSDGYIALAICIPTILLAVWLIRKVIARRNAPETLPSTFGLAMCHIPNLIWAYKKVTRHYHNFIPTGKSYEVIMYDRCGKPLQMQASQKKVDAILSLLVERAPWAVYGYSDELNRALKNDWGGFVAAVDARRSPATSTV